MLLLLAARAELADVEENEVGRADPLGVPASTVSLQIGLTTGAGGSEGRRGCRGSCGRLSVRVFHGLVLVVTVMGSVW